MDIPIFDCLSHPTVNSNWLHSKYDGMSDVKILDLKMIQNNISKTFAVGMKGIGGYSHQEFIDILKPYKNILPVAYFESIDELPELKNMGYVGVKIHPRFMNLNFLDKQLPIIIRNINENNLIPFICTYFSSRLLNPRDNLREIAVMLNKIPEERLVLLHSGVTNLLELVNMAKIYPNIVFDLSYTMCKYEGSSLDMDIKFLFNYFDRRICVGSDYPEIELSDLRRRFEYFSHGVEAQKLENIAYRNLEKLLES